MKYLYICDPSQFKSVSVHLSRVGNSGTELAGLRPLFVCNRRGRESSRGYSLLSARLRGHKSHPDPWWFTACVCFLTGASHLAPWHCCGHSALGNAVLGLVRPGGLVRLGSFLEN